MIEKRLLRPEEREVINVKVGELIGGAAESFNPCEDLNDCRIFEFVLRSWDEGTRQPPDEVFLAVRNSLGEDAFSQSISWRGRYMRYLIGATTYTGPTADLFAKFNASPEERTFAFLKALELDWRHLTKEIQQQAAEARQEELRQSLERTRKILEKPDRTGLLGKIDRFFERMKG